MKHLIIIGASRSGKTTLTQMLYKKYGYNILSLDGIFHGFIRNFPEIGLIKFGDEKRNSALILSFVKTYVAIQIWAFPEIPMIIEGTHITPKDAIELASIAPEQFKIAAIGFPNISVADKIHEVREHDNPDDWTFDNTDEELKKHIIDAIDYSQWVQKQCIELGITFLDTSVERVPVLEKFMSELL